MQMEREIGVVEERLKSFTAQLHTECGILDRLVYKHKNQHRRCSYFQYVLKVRRDLNLLKSTNMEEILDSAFIVINGNRPKQKVQLLESLKRRKCSSGKYNFLVRLLGFSRLLSQISEPLLKAAMEISTLLARSFFMKFSLTILSVLARIRVLVQQMLLDVVLIYNTVSRLSHKEQIVKLNQEGFEVFREIYPGKEKESLMLECVWQTDKYILVEKTCENENNTRATAAEQVDVPLKASNIQYNNIEVLLGDSIHTKKEGVDPIHNNDHKNTPTPNGAGSSNGNNIGPLMDRSAGSSASETNSEKLHEDGFSVPEFVDLGSTCREPGLTANAITPSRHIELRKDAKRKKKTVAFVSVNAPASSTVGESKSALHEKGIDKKDPFFDLLTGGGMNSSFS
ncbi:uncharacterized protein LOC127253372 [Andrographis paniculata]|uniref:uncharacterized protein LOC127253372 n=1 Tax=Andrographis paniculata TaxID=175694 RepID=UPI0021E80CF8|nr:uncharacterized protein LOC127253372 [Andrographis paniculata]